MVFLTVRRRFAALPSNFKGSILLMFAAFGFALMAAFIKLVGQRLPVSQVLFLRQAGMVVMLMPVLLPGFPDTLRTNKPVLQCMRVVLALLAMLFGFTAVVHLPLADAIAIGFAKGFFMTIFAVWILDEWVGIHRWAAVVVGFLGVLVMLRPGTDGFSLYGLYALAGAGAAAGVMVIIRLLTRTERPDTILAWQAIGVGVLMAVPAIWYWVWPTLTEWLLIAAIGIVSYHAQRLNILAFRHGEASLLASLDYVRLLWVTLLGFWFFGELPSGATWIGAGIIIAASIYTVHREAKRRQTLARAPNGRGFINP